MFVYPIHLFSIQAVFLRLDKEFGTRFRPNEFDGDWKRARALSLQRQLVGDRAGEGGFIGLIRIGPSLINASVDIYRVLGPYPDAVGQSSAVDRQRQEASDKEWLTIND